MKKHTMCICVVILVFSGIEVVYALPMSFNFTGHIESITVYDNFANWDFSVGDLLAGSFTYDLDNPGSAPPPIPGHTPTQRWYRYSEIWGYEDYGMNDSSYGYTCGMSVAINDVLFGTKVIDTSQERFYAEGGVEVANNSGKDLLNIQYFGIDNEMFPLTWSVFSLKLEDDTGTVLSSLEQPASFDQTLWNSAAPITMKVYGDDGTLEGRLAYEITGVLDEISSPYTPVPEPGTFLLLGLGLLGIVKLQRRKRR